MLRVLMVLLELVLLLGDENDCESATRRERWPPKDEQDDGKCYGTATLREGMPGSCGLKTHSLSLSELSSRSGVCAKQIPKPALLHCTVAQNFARRKTTREKLTTHKNKQHSLSLFSFSLSVGQFLATKLYESNFSEMRRTVFATKLRMYE
uniref:(northern house mosquito) hypothetical protein n=1 Tax=Culex pipiens TaxID=7175 RepID=A0A8D8GV90_CULPI